jgi:hypothetical protein
MPLVAAVKLRENSEKVQLCPSQIKIRDYGTHRTNHILFYSLFILIKLKIESNVFVVDALLFVSLKKVL